MSLCLCLAFFLVANLIFLVEYVITLDFPDSMLHPCLRQMSPNHPFAVVASAHLLAFDLLREDTPVHLFGFPALFPAKWRLPHHFVAVLYVFTSYFSFSALREFCCYSVEVLSRRLPA